MNSITFVFIFLMTFEFFVVATTAGSTFTTTRQCTIQVGSDIKGEDDCDYFGASADISSDGSRVIVGARFDNSNGARSDPICWYKNGTGYVRVYDYNQEGEWVQVGDDLEGEADGDEFGAAVAISGDGSRIVVGSPHNDVNGEDSGHVRVYQYEEGSWEQLGENINGEAVDEEFGRSVAISSDASRIVVGARAYARVYYFEVGGWVQLGDDLDGGAEYYNYGNSVAMSGDGDRIVIGRHFGYDYQDGTWVQLGDGEDDRFGYSVDITPDGNRIIVGVRYFVDSSSNSAQVYHYQENNGGWIQVGETIYGAKETEGDGFGRSVAISNDGNYIVVGAPYKDGYRLGTSVKIESVGSVHVYAYQDGDDWVRLATIDGKQAQDFFGISVSISGDGDRILVGSYRLLDIGKAKVFSISECES